MKKLLTLLCCLVLLTMAAGCGAPQKANSDAGGTLKVGISANLPPYEYKQNVSNTYTGFDVDLVTALAHEMGYAKVEFTDMKFNDLPQALATKKVDVIISALSITEERKKRFDFTDPYIYEALKIVVPGNTLLDAKNLTSVQGLRVAVEEGATAMEEAKRQNAREIITCKNTLEALEMAVAGKVDVVLADKLAAAYFAQHVLRGSISFANDTEFSPAPYALAVRKGDKEMLAKLNKALATYRRSKDFQFLCQTYFGTMSPKQKK